MVERVLRGGEAPPFEPSEHAPVRPGGALTVRVGGQEIPAISGATLLEVVNAAGIDIRSYCGGNCSCGTCRVEVRGRGLSKRSSMEELVLGSEAVGRGDRLACQAQVIGPVVVTIPEWF